MHSCNLRDRGCNVDNLSYTSQTNSTSSSTVGVRTRRLEVMNGSLPPAAASCGPSPAMTLSTTFFRISLRWLMCGLRGSERRHTC